jgi:hypothetical protein
MQHSKNKIENEVYVPIVRTDEPDDENLPVTVMTAVSVPVWKTPSVFKVANASQKTDTPDFLSTVSASPFAASSDTESDLFGTDDLPGDQKIQTTDAVILAERTVKPSLWARLVFLVSQHSPLSITEADLSRINLYLCAGGLLIAVLFIFFVLH